MEKRPTRTELRSQVDTFAEHCRAHGLSVTSQRLAIFEALAASREHPSAEQIHKAVRRRIPTLSLATVYKKTDLKLTTDGKKTEVTGLVTGLSAFLLVMGGALSLVWFGRLV